MMVFITRGKRSHLDQNAWSGMVQLELNLHNMCHAYAHSQQQSHLFHQQLHVLIIKPYLPPLPLTLLLWNHHCVCVGGCRGLPLRLTIKVIMNLS